MAEFGFGQHFDISHDLVFFEKGIRFTFSAAKGHSDDSNKSSCTGSQYDRYLQVRFWDMVSASEENTESDRYILDQLHFDIIRAGYEQIYGAREM
jgi:hypothetical protein